MKPIKFTQKGDRVIYHYSFSDLRKFVSRGNSHGDAGSILFGELGNNRIYKSYGTIENPNTSRFTITFRHYELFDGKRLTPQEVIDYVPKEEPLLTNYRFIFLDTEKNDNQGRD